MSRTGHRILEAVFVGYLLLVAVILLAPSSAAPSSVVTWLVGFANGHGLPATLVTYDRVEFAMNAAMGVPVSALGSVLVPRWTWHQWTAWGFVGALTVELAQGLLLPGRDPAFRDVVANATGVFAGVMLVRLVRPIIS